MKQFFRNICRQLSNFQLAFLTGQGSNYLSKRVTLSTRGYDRIIKVIDYNEMSGTVDRIMKVYDKRTWKDLYSIETDFINNGKYLKAYFVRILSQKCAVRYYESGRNISNKILLAWYLFFEGREEIAENIISKELRRPLLRLTKSKLCVLRDIISGNIKKDYLQKKLLEYNLGLYNKNVTVIGPLSSEEALDSLNKEDVSVQINYFPENYGRDPDISFYNGAIMKSLASGDRLLPELSCYVFHRFVYEFQNCLVQNGKAKLTYRSDYIFGLGQPNMLPNILFHLIAMKPNEIKVSGFNLYMSKSVYNNSYLNYDVKNRDITVLKASFAQHNIISQYLFIYVLYKNCFIKADEMLKEILDNGIEYYLKNLEDLIEK